MKIKFLNSLLLEARLEVLSGLRTPSFVVPAVVFPILLYLFFGVFMVQGQLQDSVQASTYNLINYMVFGLMAPALFNFGANVAQERESGWLELKLISPLPASYYLFAKCLSALTFTLLISVLLFSTAWMFGDVQLSWIVWVKLFALGVVGTIPFCFLGLVIGLKFSAKGASAMTNLVFLPMAMLSGLWVPIFLMPEFMQQFAWILPSYHLSQLGLASVGLGQGHSTYFHLFVLSVISTILMMLAVVLYKSEGMSRRKRHRP
ncbi:ABC transporter permease [Pseudoalteromonas luteoviolacea]|uniref:ABC transporter permease n=1 Tax=Pseudoalteromonas luteoviolacea TaxID=43657 RepID=UPI001B396526|nr:ABC transporter permease [Pseudoalteromonas luteoviolacea]MBQ4813306.1 ABC transporter permease [Pseudoalteromonas luteoviolacea]